MIGYDLSMTNKGFAMTKLFILSLATLLMSLNSYAGERREKMRAAFEACVQENNLQKPERGSRPSDEDRATMAACLKGKGIEKPERSRGRKGPRPVKQEVEEEN